MDKSQPKDIRQITKGEMRTDMSCCTNLYEIFNTSNFVFKNYQCKKVTIATKAGEKDEF